MLSCRIRAPRLPKMRLRSAAPTRCRCSRSSDGAAALRAAVSARAASPRSGHPDERNELAPLHSITSSARARSVMNSRRFIQSPRWHGPRTRPAKKPQVMRPSSD
jgi:hypothetical protein